MQWELFHDSLTSTTMKTKDRGRQRVSFTSACYVHIAMEPVPCKFSHFVNVHFNHQSSGRFCLFASTWLFKSRIDWEAAVPSADGVTVWQSFMRNVTHILVCLWGVKANCSFSSSEFLADISPAVPSARCLMARQLTQAKKRNKQKKKPTHQHWLYQQLLLEFFKRCRLKQLDFWHCFSHCSFLGS